MLRLLRQGGAGQWLMGAIVVAIIIVFIVPAVSGQGGSLSTECSVKVQGRCVNVKDYFAAYGLITASEMSAKEMRGLNLKTAALEGLVERELLLLEAKRLGITLSEAELDAELMAGRIHVSIPVEQHEYLARPTRIGKEMVRYLPVNDPTTQAFDYATYERIIRNVTGRSAGDYRDQARAEVLANRVRQLVRSRVRVSEDEVWSQYKQAQARASARTVNVDKPWFARFAIDTSDAALTAWLKEHEAEVDEKWKTASSEWVAGCAVVRELLVAVPPGADDEEKAAAGARINAAVGRVKGSSFAEVARLESDGLSAPVGGMLGCFSEKYGPGHQELNAALEGLKPGQLTPVLDTPNGYVTLMLQARLAEADIEKVGKREVARAMMAVDLTAQRSKAFAEALLDAAKGGESLEEATTRLVREYASRGKPLKADEVPPGSEANERPKVNITPSFSVGSRPVQGALEDAAAHAFALEKPDQVHPNLIATRTGFAVLQLKEKTEATREDFDKERFDFAERLRDVKEQEALRLYITALKKRAETAIVRNTALTAEKSDKPDGEAP
ncbi:MAG: SurA N-terminal domain-containing protein [Polyangiaceae bacterium]|nr:SurA N-terminal domain-containing protein [Polyangiaceae bacterium]MCW5789931.1 SurA N-terminal domain-containing protein [Polyangiaceae bacterium]